MASTYYHDTPRRSNSKSKRRTAARRLGALDIMERLICSGPECGLEYEKQASDYFSWEERAVLLCIATLISERGDNNYVLWPEDVDQNVVSMDMVSTILEAAVNLIGAYLGILYAGYSGGEFNNVKKSLINLTSKGYLELSQLGSIFIPFCVSYHSYDQPRCHALCAWSIPKRISYVRSCIAEQENRSVANVIPAVASITDTPSSQSVTATHLKLVVSGEPSRRPDELRPGLATALKWFRDRPTLFVGPDRLRRDPAVRQCHDEINVPHKAAREAHKTVSGEFGAKPGRPRAPGNMES